MSYNDKLLTVSLYLIIILIMKNELCLQPYKITMSQNALTAIELRIMTLVLFKLKDEQIKGFNLDVEDELALFKDMKAKIVTIDKADILIGENHTKLKASLDSLRKRSITIKTKRGTLGIGLIQKWWHSDDNTQVQLYIEEVILPELIFLGKNYTKFGIEFCFKTQCKYAIRWYQLACHWRNNGVFYISIDEIRILFQIDKSQYKRTLDLNNRVIKYPLKELKEKADLWLEIIETKKQGRNIVGYTFKVKKRNMLEDTEEPELTLE